MNVSDFLPTARRELLHTAQLRRLGLPDRAIAARVRGGELVRLRPGYFVGAALWESLFPEQRHTLVLLAAQRAAAGPLAFSHRSAAVLHDLPVWSAWLGQRSPDVRRAQTTVARRARGGVNQVMARHVAALPPCDLTEVHGFAVTTAERTLLDLARGDEFSVALAAADALLVRAVERSRDGRGSGGHGRNRYGGDGYGGDAHREALAAWRSRAFESIARQSGNPGVRAQRALVALADSRAESPLETLSRLRFLQLGVGVDIQVPVMAESGGALRLDFVLTGLGVWGECDGKAKYTNASMRRERTPEEVVYAEKRRHDWVAGTTGMRCIRWGVREVVTRDRFAAHLRAHGIAVPGAPSRALGPAVAGFLAGLP